MKQKLGSISDCCHLELTRYHCLEHKCAWVFAVVTFILFALALLMVLSSGVIFSPQSELAWLALLLFLLGTFCMICAWAHTLMALCQLDKSSGLLDLLKKEGMDLEDREATEQDLYINDFEPLDHLTQLIEEKRHNLKLAFDELKLGGWALAIMSLLIVSIEIVR